MAKKRSKKRWKLTDEQWAKIEPLLPKLKKSKRGGRPWVDNRKVFEGILWILRTGAPWADLPKTICQWFNLLATAARLGRAGCLARCLASISWPSWMSEASLTGANALSTAVSHLLKKGRMRRKDQDEARERSGWWWSTAKVFLWETTWTLRPRRKSSSSKRRSKT